MPDPMTTGIAVALLLLCALHWRLTGMPARLWGIARSELAKAQAADDAEAHKALLDAANTKAGSLLAGVRQYQEQIAADYRKQVADAELRARVADRHATDTGTALEAATALVRELRATIDGLGELPALVRELRALGTAMASGTAAAPASEESVTAAEADDGRKTVEIKPPVTGAPAASATVAPSATATDDEGWDDPEERTKVIDAGKLAPGVTPRARVPELRPPLVPRAALPPAPVQNEAEARAAKPEGSG